MQESTISDIRNQDLVEPQDERTSYSSLAKSAQYGQLQRVRQPGVVRHSYILRERPELFDLFAPSTRIEYTRRAPSERSFVVALSFLCLLGARTGDAR